MKPSLFFKILFVLGISGHAYASGNLLKKALMKNLTTSFASTMGERIGDTEDLSGISWLPNRAMEVPWADVERLTITCLGMATDADKAMMLREFSDDELSRKEISVNRDGMLMHHLGGGVGLRLDSDETYIYVMLRNGQIFATPEQEIDSVGPVRVHHSALLSGMDKILGPVAAGELRVSKSGKILSINENSGHYAPSGRTGLVVQELSARSKGLVTDKEAKIAYYDVSTSKPLKRLEVDILSKRQLRDLLSGISPLNEKLISGL